MPCARRAAVLIVFGIFGLRTTARSHGRKRSDKSSLVEATPPAAPLTTGRRALMGFSSVNTLRLRVAPLIAVTARGEHIPRDLDACINHRRAMRDYVRGTINFETSGGEATRLELASSARKEKLLPIRPYDKSYRDV